MVDDIKKIKVTIIDDEKDLVEAIKGLLEPRNFEVTYAYDGLSGLELIKKERPDLIILDITMPGMDGRDVISKIKKNEDTKDIPVIFLTAKSESFEREYGIELGAHQYVTKPYNSSDLLKHIANILKL